MDSVNSTSRVLGGAFLLQAITSLISGLILKLALTPTGNISESMIKVANNAWLMRANILVDMITAFGVIFLGAVLFITLRNQNETVALVAMGFYVLEAALVATSKIASFSLLRTSQEYVTAGHPAYLQTIGNLALESMDFVGATLSMLAFCLGAILFYYLLDKSRIVPRALSLWGLIAVFPCLVGTLFAVFGHQVSFFLYLPYVPFEFTIGVWILVKGMNSASEPKQP
ncbi:MAG TPA: DUF4386 domain-containing protein [Terriglobia bacterium]|nr:DUF4386 domain-containing protein [Terriglobia bacterium]